MHTNAKASPPLLLLLSLVILLFMTPHVLANGNAYLRDVENQIRLHVHQLKPGTIDVELPDESLMRPGPAEAMAAKKDFCRKQYGTDDLDFCAKKMAGDASGSDVAVENMKKTCKERWGIANWGDCVRKLGEAGDTKTGDESASASASGEKGKFLNFCRFTYGTEDLEACRKKIAQVQKRGY